MLVMLLVLVFVLVALAVSKTIFQIIPKFGN
nr:MAG TPA: hypothetical protein [Microviridae sp.]